MEAEEIDIALDELENRLDRLRSLYEQYFLGIEKIEPSIARKDVDRRFWVLRRTQIRNTARRFRLQVLVQRYNTFQQYWARICREIENGTYHRHLLKAQKKFGEEPKTWAAKKRLAAYTDDDAKAHPGPSAAPSEDLGTMLESGDDLVAEAEKAAAAALASQAVRQAREPEQAGASANTPKARPTQKRFDDLGPLDLDFDEEPSPAKAAKPAAARPQALVLPDLGEAPARPAASPLPAAPGRPAVPPAATATPPHAARTVPQPAGKPPLPTRAAAAPANGAAASPDAPARPRPPTAAAAGPRPAPPANGAAASPTSAGISDERVRQLHAELVETRRKLQQTDQVSLDSLAKTLRDTEQRLKTQHQGRSVDFQVVVRDGKPVVKPVVRK